MIQNSMTSESNKYLTWECTFIFGSGFTSHVQPGQTLELVHIPEAHADCVLSRSVVSDSMQPYGRSSARFLCPWDSPGKNNRVGCHALLQGVFLTQGSNPPSPALQADSSPLPTWKPTR